MNIPIYGLIYSYIITLMHIIFGVGILIADASVRMSVFTFIIPIPDF